MWIRIDTDIITHRKVLVLRMSCGLATDAALGKLLALFCRLADNRSRGDVSQLHPSVLEEWALWTGEPGLFDRAFREVFVTDGLITGWYRQAKLIERQEKDAERKRTKRRTRGGSTSAGRPADDDADVGTTSRGRMSVTGTKNEDENDDLLSFLPSGDSAESPNAPREPQSASDVARVLTVAANRAISQKWTEQTRPIFAGAGTSLETAEALLSERIPVLFARDSIVAQVLASKKPRPMTSLNWFLNGVRDDWTAHREREAARSSPYVEPTERPSDTPPPNGMRGRSHAAGIGAEVAESAEAAAREVMARRGGVVT